MTAPARPADPNKAFVPPPGWTPPRQTTQMAAVAPTPAAPAPVPAPAPAPAASPQADIAAAQSGAVPFSATKSPPVGGPLQVAVIQFRPMSSELSGNDYTVLAKVAQIQRANGATVRVVAHSAEDATASSVEALARGNLEVSRQRALAVANRLVQLGVPANRIVAEAASDQEPAYQTNTARGVAANRRAEIFVDF